MNSCTHSLGCPVAETERASFEKSAGRVIKAIAARLRTWVSRSGLDPITAYLADAADHADLERRLRALDRIGR